MKTKLYNGLSLIQIDLMVLKLYHDQYLNRKKILKIVDVTLKSMLDQIKIQIF